MNSIFSFNDYIEIEFYLYEDNEYKKALVNLLELTKYIKVSEFYFGDYYNDKLEDFNEDRLNEALNNDWDEYENYFLSLHGIRNQFFNLRISPFLKEVSMVKIRLCKSIFEKNKMDILSICDKIACSKAMMYGFADASVDNPYFHNGYGKLRFGAHWLMWFGEWSLKYFNEHKMQLIKENTYDFIQNDQVTRAQLYDSPWKYKSKDFHKKYRNFMRKLKFEEVVLEYNKKREFSLVDKNSFT